MRDGVHVRSIVEGVPAGSPCPSGTGTFENFEGTLIPKSTPTITRTVQRLGATYYSPRDIGTFPSVWAQSFMYTDFFGLACSSGSFSYKSCRAILFVFFI